VLSKRGDSDDVGLAVSILAPREHIEGGRIDGSRAEYGLIQGPPSPLLAAEAPSQLHKRYFPGLQLHHTLAESRQFQRELSCLLSMRSHERVDF
jgi:hypothetical protein